MMYTTLRCIKIGNHQTTAASFIFNAKDDVMTSDVGLGLGSEHWVRGYATLHRSYAGMALFWDAKRRVYD